MSAHGNEKTASGKFHLPSVRSRPRHLVLYEPPVGLAAARSTPQSRRVGPILGVAICSGGLSWDTGGPRNRLIRGSSCSVRYRTGPPRHTSAGFRGLRVAIELGSTQPKCATLLTDARLSGLHDVVAAVQNAWRNRWFESNTNPSWIVQGMVRTKRTFR